MAVIIETTLGDITVDLFLKERPRSSLNFLKLCKMKYYNFNLFHMVNRGFIAQTGDPTGSGEGGESIWGVIEGESKRYFEAEVNPRIKHTTAGLVSFVGDKNNMLGSQFFITLASDLTYLDAQHCIFGEVVEGFDVLHLLNEAICDNDHRPYQDIRITHTVILEDPFSDPKGIMIPDSSPEPTAIHLQGGRIAPDEDIDETAGKSAKEIAEIIADREAKARATILEMVGDIPDADMAPPENVLFVCKLNPVTNDDDLEIIFSRFGKIKSCEVIRDKKTGDSLQYAFVEFENEKSCEDAYFKMDNVLIDDRRIHVDFSQSVAKVRWFGKGRITYLNDNEDKNYAKSDLGNGKYQRSNKQKDSGHSIQNKIKRNDSDFDTYNLEKQKHSHSKTDKYQLSSDLKRNIKGSDKKYSRNDDTSNRRNRSKSKEKYDDDSGRAKISKYDRKDIGAIKNVNEKLYETNKMHRKRRSRSREHVYNQKNRTDSEQREKSRRKHEKSDKYNKSKYEEKSRRSEMENKDYRTREPAKKLKSERSRKKKSRDSLSEEYSSTERTKSSAKHKKKSKRKHKSRSTSESSDS